MPKTGWVPPSIWVKLWLFAKTHRLFQVSCVSHFLMQKIIANTNRFTFTPKEALGDSKSITKNKCTLLLLATVRCPPPPSTTPSEGIILPYATKITELEKGTLPLCLIFSHWQKGFDKCVVSASTPAVVSLCWHCCSWAIQQHASLWRRLSHTQHHQGITRNMWVKLTSTQTHTRRNPSTHHHVHTSQARWQEILSNLMWRHSSHLWRQTNTTPEQFFSSLYSTNV